MSGINPSSNSQLFSLAIQDLAGKKPDLGVDPFAKNNKFVRFCQQFVDFFSGGKYGQSLHEKRLEKQDVIDSVKGVIKMAILQKDALENIAEYEGVGFEYEGHSYFIHEDASGGLRISEGYDIAHGIFIPDISFNTLVDEVYNDDLENHTLSLEDTQAAQTLNTPPTVSQAATDNSHVESVPVEADLIDLHVESDTDRQARTEALDKILHDAQDMLAIQEDEPEHIATQKEPVSPTLTTPQSPLQSADEVDHAKRASLTSDQADPAAGAGTESTIDPLDKTYDEFEEIFASITGKSDPVAAQKKPVSPSDDENKV
ncbi:MAG: hypothetical protein ACRC5A_14265 [Enterobacteriaceae bacterium]